MANLLTQEEIETLLSGLSTDGGPDGWEEGHGAAYPADVIPFSFVNQDRIVRGGMPTLEIIHDRFARLMRTSLTQMLRRSVDVSVLTHEELKFGEFNRILPSPTSLHVLRLEPLKGYALLALPGNLITPPPVAATRGFTRAEALRTSAFWLVSLAIGNQALVGTQSKPAGAQPQLSGGNGGGR